MQKLWNWILPEKCLGLGGGGELSCQGLKLKNTIDDVNIVAAG